MASCSTSKNLPSGQYTGYLSPTDQPEKRTLLNYEVTHQEEDVSLQIYLP